MRKGLTLLILSIVVTVSACAAPVTIAPAPLPTIAILPPTAIPIATTVLPTEPTALPTAVAPTPAPQTADQKTYTNSDFGIKFQFPSAWFGPSEYVSEQMLRLEIGSDNVYPYGTDPTERITNVKNSYYVVIQYSKNDQNTYWKEAYESLVNLKDGEAVTTARSKLIKVRDLNIGKFKGIEYIATLSDTAQTEPLYLRQVILFDDTPNVVTLMAQPNNVEIAEGTSWREAYQMVDEMNLETFHQIVESITIE